MYSDRDILLILKENPDLSYQTVLDILEGLEDLKNGDIETCDLDDLDLELWDNTLLDDLEDDTWEGPDGL